MKNSLLVRLTMVALFLTGCIKDNPDEFPEQFTFHWNGRTLYRSWARNLYYLDTGVDIYLSYDGELVVCARRLSFDTNDGPLPDSFPTYIEIRVPHPLVSGPSTFFLEPDAVVLFCGVDAKYHIRVPNEDGKGFHKQEIECDYVGSEQVYYDFGGKVITSPTFFSMTIDEIETESFPKESAELRLVRVSGSFYGSVEIEDDDRMRESRFDGTFSYVRK